MISDCGNRIRGIKVETRYYQLKPGQSTPYGYVRLVAEPGSLPDGLLKPRQFRGISGQGGLEYVLNNLYLGVRDYNRRWTRERENELNRELAGLNKKLCKSISELEGIKEQINKKLVELGEVERNIL